MTTLGSRIEPDPHLAPPPHSVESRTGTETNPPRKHSMRHRTLHPIALPKRADFGGGPPVSCAAVLLLVLAAFSTLPAVARASSGPSIFTYMNVTDPATGKVGCLEDPNHICSSSFCLRSKAICAEPCGSANSSMSYPYACTAGNGLPLSSWRYELNLTVASSPGRCQLDQMAWSAIEAPRTRWGSHDSKAMCYALADCPWDELEAAFGRDLGPAELRPPAYAGAPAFTVRNITLRPRTGAHLDNATLWCGIAMSCPVDLASLGSGSRVVPGGAADPGGTRYLCLPAEDGKMAMMVKMDGKGDVACLTKAWSERQCRQLTPACCSVLKPEYDQPGNIGPATHGLPYLSCADLPDSDRTAPNHFCARGRALLDQAKPPQIGPEPGLLGFNCTYIGPTDPKVDTSGTGPWTAAGGLVGRRNANGSFSILTISLGDLSRDGSCIANVAVTAPPGAPSRPLNFNSDLPFLEALAVDGDLGQWMCVEACPGTGQWIRGRRFFESAQIEQTTGDELFDHNAVPFIYSDPACSAPAVAFTKAGHHYSCRRPMASPYYWDPWCARMVAAAFGTETTTCAKFDPRRVCVMSPADDGHYVSAYTVTVAQPDGTNATVPQCWGPVAKRCSWFADAKCSLLARDEPSPAYSPSVGYVCGPKEEGWCRIAAEALWLVPRTTPTAFPPRPSPTPSPTSAPSAWIYCVQSCADHGNAVVVRLSASGRAECLGPDAVRCSWYRPGCEELAPGEPEPALQDNLGRRTCTAEEEAAKGSWCEAAARMLAGGKPTPCPTGTMAGPTDTETRSTARSTESQAGASPTARPTAARTTVSTGAIETGRVSGEGRGRSRDSLPWACFVAAISSAFLVVAGAIV
ncbi:hypothetical protein DFJ74DRAFT_49929 [Hyaloraphidium curvatum]|nr:hypothetical protein DFJ74DRAFT_49929 [Hyaloraphidium curvatum]